MSVDFTVFKGTPQGILEETARRPAPTGNQVLVKITHSGICGTDEHYKEANIVLGHEGIGSVQQIGESVQGFQLGDVVGWGYVHKTCGNCELCLCGEDQYCPNKELYGSHNVYQGSFGSHAIWDASFLFHIPEGLAPEYAAPLMCGGATVFNVIERYNIRPTDRVGVVGVGGLGHMAIQFLAKMGASVVGFSSTEEKRDEALQLGATEFYATKSATELNIGKPLDHLIVTTSFPPDWPLLLGILKPTATIYPLTLTYGMVDIPIFPVMVNGITIQGTAVAGRSVHRRMLDFAARHRIQPVIERFPMTKSGIDEGMAKLREGKMRYRAVLVA
ncbi:chaperonin 10-like protein [Mycena belliarum]|uniref:Chaperonin 10-like protein n=1 Tax=Mycena belliarum TaxID=1033014 RepID=A0AAD6XRN8_9AGAR|nr:chaperonin 10-like protein [Mycena belliae]